MRDAARLRKRHVGIQAIDAARAGINQMLHAIMPTAFQYIHKTVDIRLHVSIRISNRIPYASLSRQIAHPVELLIGKQHLHRLPVFQIHPDKPIVRILRALRQLIPPDAIPIDTRLLQTAILQIHIIIIIQIIQAYDFIPALQETEGDEGGDETGGAGEEEFHIIYYCNKPFRNLLPYIHLITEAGIRRKTKRDIG